LRMILRVFGPTLRVVPAATARMLAMEFARFLDLQFAGRVNLTDIVDAVCVTAARARAELVSVDELCLRHRGLGRAFVVFVAVVLPRKSAQVVQVISSVSVPTVL
jgi:hypothetical protein